MGKIKHLKKNVRMTVWYYFFSMAKAMSYSAKGIFKFVKLINWIIHSFSKYILHTCSVTGLFSTTFGETELRMRGAKIPACVELGVLHLFSSTSKQCLC